MATVQVAGVQFSVVRRNGLDPDEVAVALTMLQRERDELYARTQRLQQAALAAEDQVVRMRAQTQDEADALRAAASADAGQIMQEALRLRLEADGERARLLADLSAESGRLGAEAERLRAEIESLRVDAQQQRAAAEAAQADCARAQADATAIRTAAEQERAAMLAQAATTARDQLAPLQRQLAQQLAALTSEARAFALAGGVTLPADSEDTNSTDPDGRTPPAHRVVAVADACADTEDSTGPHTSRLAAMIDDDRDQATIPASDTHAVAEVGESSQEEASASTGNTTRQPARASVVADSNAAAAAPTSRNADAPAVGPSVAANQPAVREQDTGDARAGASLPGLRVPGQPAEIVVRTLGSILESPLDEQATGSSST